MEIVLAVVQLGLGTFFLAVMVAGFFKGELNIIERVALFAAAICLIMPEMISSVIGIVIGVAVLAVSAFKASKTNKVAA